MGKKIKVGIMSMQRIINYGSYLQSYGLKGLIEEEVGANVEFVDYEYQGSLVEIEKEGFLKKIYKNLNPISYLNKKKFLKNVRNSYNKSLADIGITDCKNYNPKLDKLVIGSDEVFNCLQSYPVGYSKDLFGDGYESIDVISYAASFGYTTYEGLIKYHVDSEISKMLSKFKNISVRDSNSADIVLKLTDNKPVINLDPVLMYDFNNEIKKYQTNLKNYIVIYAYTGRLSREEEKIIKKFAKKQNKKIVSIGYYSSIADENIICNPLYVFSYFKNADFIITDTFHGTIFSIKMNSKFCTIIRDSNKNKLLDLLERLEQTDRIITNMNNIEKLYHKKMDYEKTNKILQHEKEKAIDYLKTSLL